MDQMLPDGSVIVDIVLCFFFLLPHINDSGTGQPPPRRLFLLVLVDCHWTIGKLDGYGGILD